MMFSKSAVAVVIAAFVTSISADVGANSTIDPNSVSLNDRVSWCVSQSNVCGTLCDGDYGKNDCDEDTLKYECTCTANSSTPGLAYYKGTIPTFICEETFKQCNANHAGVASALAKCLADEKSNCGTFESANLTFAVSSSSSAAATPTSGTKSAGAASSTPTGTTAPTTSASHGAAATNIAGAGLLAAGVGAVFGLML